MSKTIQVREVPEDVHAALRARAAIAGVSLSEYVLGEITEVASRPEVADVLRRAARRTTGAPVDAIVAAVRSGRDHE